MKPAYLFAIIILFFLPARSFSQEMIHSIRLGNTRNSQMTYDKQGHTRMVKCTYDDILKEPKIVCDRPNCEVTQFSYTILPTGSEVVGPLYNKGSELNDPLKTWIQKLSDTGDSKARIIISAIEVKCYEKSARVKGQLLYSFK